MGTRSIYRELGQHHTPLVRPLGEASRRAEPEPASGRASKLWLPTARVVDIGYCGYSEPFGGAGEGHTGLRLGLASPYLRIRRYIGWERGLMIWGNDGLVRESVN